MNKWICVLLLSAVSTSAIGSSAVRLEAYPTPPWHATKSGSLSGPPVDVLECVFGALDRPFELIAAPWRRAQMDTKSGHADGFFSASREPDDETYSSLSAPIGLEKWYWVSAGSTHLFTDAFPDDLRIGAVNGSSQMVWLAQQGINISEQVSEQAQLRALLDSQRIDLYLASLEALTERNTEQLARQGVSLRFARYAPLRASFSRSFLAANPGFLEQFNSHLASCQTGISVLAENERHKLHLLLGTLVTPWLASQEVLQAITRSNEEHRTLDQATILSLDKQWRGEVQSGKYDIAQSMLDNSLSRYLRVLRARQDGLITEIIVTDKKGVNVGISNLTTDYWQGDEDKFLKTSILKSGFYLSDINFDRSTQKFQVQASFPIRTDGALAGVVTVGLDIEKALLKD